MKIIEKENVDYFRYAVGKIAFFRFYKEFELIENYPYSNMFLLKIKSDGKNTNDILVSIFGKPTMKYKDYISNEYKENEQLQIYYENKRFDDLKENKLFESKYIKIYSELLESAFKNFSAFLNHLNENEKKLLEPLFVSVSNEDIKLFKYISAKSINKREYRILDGSVSFSSPKVFNDPFDCNIQFSNNKDMSNIFRVLCLTESHTNLLMWSYYGDSHKGYCIERNQSTINKTINNFQLNGLCIMGYVDYKPKRPQIKAPVDKFSYTDLKFYIDASFTKYKEWEHEKEFRYVIILDEDQQEEDFLGKEHLLMDIPYDKVFMGFNGNKTYIYNSNNNLIPIIVMSKHDTEYKVFV